MKKRVGLIRSRHITQKVLHILRCRLVVQGEDNGLAKRADENPSVAGRILKHSVNVKRDPIGLSLTVREEVLVDFTFHIWDTVWVANSRIVPWDTVLLNHLKFFRLIRSNPEINQVLK